MKKKLRLYCGLLTLVLVAAIVCDLVHVNYSSSTDKEREATIRVLPTRSVRNFTSARSRRNSRRQKR